MIRGGYNGFFPLICGFKPKRNSMYKTQQFRPLRHAASTSKMRTLQGKLALLPSKIPLEFLQLETVTAANKNSAQTAAFASPPRRRRAFSY
jgi:hypothetical protein